MILLFLYGAICTAAVVVATFFAKQWQRTRDRLFLFFSLAFAALAVERILLAAINPTDELAPYVYLVRLVAVLLIIAAIIDKNRQP